jgi:hypothetical protein
MKKIITFLVAAFIAVALNAQEEDFLHKKWHYVVDAIATVESGKNPKVVSKDGLYVGYLQIAKIMVDECNRINGYKKYTYADRYDKEKSINMFIDFQEHYNPDCNVEKAIRLWNSGDIKCMERKARTEGYFQRVMKHYVVQEEKIM